jgi:Skp family chaperone for outer membrane proteins
MNLKRKSIFILLTALAAVLLVSGCGKAKIGYFDGQRIMKESPQIQTIVDEGNAALATANKENADQLAANQASMSEEDLKKDQAKTQAKMQALQQRYSSELKTKVDAAVADIVKAKELDVVLDNEGADKSVVQGGTDITDEVIQKLQ